ncbi:MAG: rhomboid family intramembrane serine protease [Pseudomonadota bacterium]
MLFLPFKADFPLARLPILTILVCLICSGVFLKQQSDWGKFESAVQRFCAVDRSHIDQMVLQRVDAYAGARFCGQAMYNISMSESPDQEITAIVGQIQPLSGFNRDDSKRYMERILQDELQLFQRFVPDDPDSRVAYNTASWNPIHMLTASFAHGDWGHIIFNLIFFIAFAAAVEVIAGSLAFAGFIVLGSLIIGVTDSVIATLVDDHHWTLGLSGIVMGMIGLFAYLLPQGRIRCFYWFLILFGTLSVPGWLLALWYIGGDIFQLIRHDDHGGINVIAHVTGGIAGYLYGIVFLNKARNRAAATQREHQRQATTP